MRRCVTFSLLLASLICPGCAARLTEQQRQWFDEGQDAYDTQRYGAAIAKLSRFVNEVQIQPELANAHYLRGLSYAKRGERRAAQADLHRSVKTIEKTDAVWRAYVVLGTLDYESESWNAAAENLRAAESRMPIDAPRDAILWRLAICFERGGRWGAARRVFRRIREEFPDGVYAEAAARRVLRNATHFAIQCGVFASQENANTLRIRLARYNLPATVSRERGKRTPRFVVLVGRIARYDDARRQLEQVRKHVSDAVLWP